MKEMNVQIVSLLCMMAIIVSKVQSSWWHNCFFFLPFNQGDAVAKFAAENLHKRMIKDESYYEKQYETAMKRAFLGTDKDLHASEF
jgi:hypothetical protein